MTVSFPEASQMYQEMMFYQLSEKLSVQGSRHIKLTSDQRLVK